MTTHGKYRLRTWLRGRLPASLQWVAPKGRRDCGAHEWYYAGDTEDNCYHCTVGRRLHAVSVHDKQLAAWREEQIRTLDDRLAAAPDFDPGE